jgi:hypothetical protein
MAPLLLAWLSWSAYRFRGTTSRRWFFATLFAVGYIACVAVAALHERTSRTLDRYADRLANGIEAAHLPPDWGKGFSPNDRTKHSLMLARQTFVSYGMRVRYFDLNGDLQDFTPTDEDVKSREFHLQHLAESRALETRMSVVAIAWLTVPLVAIGLSLVPVWRQFRT